MGSNSEETATLDPSPEPSDELSFQPLKPDIFAYVQNNLMSKNTKLFSMLALLNANVPESYLDLEECQLILGPPDHIHGENALKGRMEPFSCLIELTSSGVHLMNPDIATRYLDVLADLNITINTIVKDCIYLLCWNKASTNTIRFLQDLLMGNTVVEHSKEVSLNLVEKIMEEQKKTSTQLPAMATESGSDNSLTLQINIESFLNFFFSLFKPDLSNNAVRKSWNTKLFSILSLLKAYVPESYLTMRECQRILQLLPELGEKFSFENRMMPFLSLTRVSCGRVSLIHTAIANKSLELLGEVSISRSSIADDCISLLCGEQATPHIVKFIKLLLTQRKKSKNGKENFSLLIQDIWNQEGGSDEAISVLEHASCEFDDKFVYPQTIARLYYQKENDYSKAEGWAHEAISRDRKNSYVADTLGQVYKHWLIKVISPLQINDRVEKAIKAFKDVEKKAERELEDSTNSFNNRGHFGLIQVAQIIARNCDCFRRFKETLQGDVEAKFEFFEWYLSYSKIDRVTVEPDYFWKDVASCYNKYTAKHASDSTSFAALLDCLNHGLFVSKEKRAFKDAVTEKTESDLKRIRDELKTIYERNRDDVKVAERYILSNIILSNKVPDSPSLPQVRELQSILQRFLHNGMNGTDPEFYLLVLLLFWPVENLQRKQKVDNTIKIDLEEKVILMEKSYISIYGKYLRGRYLLPLFFLGKGSGLSRWIHRSRLDEVVERHIETELHDDRNRNKTKRRMINNTWNSGKVWELPEIQSILQPIQITLQLSGEEAKVCVRGKTLKARTDFKAGSQTTSNALYYFGLNIRGPVVFKGEAP